MQVVDNLKALKGRLDKNFPCEAFEIELIELCLDAISNKKKKLSAEKFQLSIEKSNKPETSFFGDKWHEEIDEKIEAVNQKIEWLSQ